MIQIAIVEDDANCAQELQSFITNTGIEIQRQRQKLEDFKLLKKDYESYESNRGL